MEGIVLLMVALAPWALGAVYPIFEYALYCGVFALALLWTARCLLLGRFIWFASPAALAIAAIFLIGVLQLVPLPSFVLKVVSYSTASEYDFLLPGVHEVVSAGDPPAAAP